MAQTLCAPYEFRGASPNSSIALICLPVHNCTLVEVEVTPPSPTTDRVCKCDEWGDVGVLAPLWRILAVLFLFCGTAVICDDYFTPALERITEAWDLSQDVAGATFMAAGSSAPELFTSLIAVFAPKNKCGVSAESVGVGTIVGSAVFNILVIIGLSALLGCRPGQYLDLEWRPLLRDNCFYVLSIVLLVVFVLDGEVWWGESLCMLCAYFSYIVFMYFNASICGKYGRIGLEDDDLDDEFDDLPTPHSRLEMVPLGQASKDVEDGEDGGEEQQSTGRSWKVETFTRPATCFETILDCPGACVETCTDVPDGLVAKLWFALMMPWTIAFKFTVPDCNTPMWRDYYMLSFVLSIVWIAAICWGMVTWSVELAEMAELSPTIMAFTVLAAGTSIPDAMESIIVARMNMADMAVSNALGSNIFDILFGLSVPFLLASLRNHLEGEYSPIVMCVKDLKVYIGVLVMTLAFTMGGIVASKFRLGRGLGSALIVMYLLVVVVAILRDLDVVELGDSCS